MKWKKLLFLPGWLLVLLTLLSAALLTLVFVKGWEQTIPACLVYALSFYTLSTVTVFCVLVLPGKLGKLKERIYADPLGNRYMTDPEFRAGAGMHTSVYVNLAYVVIQMVSWYTNRSWWFVVLALYYLILALLWALLTGFARSHSLESAVPRQWRRARICAYILLLINLSLSAAVLMILFQNKGYDYPGILIYVMALYTFYCAIHAAVGLIKYRTGKSPILAVSKIVSLSAALVSVLNLETAMFAQFGKDLPVEDQQIFIILTGAGVSITVITLSVALIVRATKEIGRDKNEK